jgi:hypothetical protein
MFLVLGAWLRGWWGAEEVMDESADFGVVRCN